MFKSHFSAFLRSPLVRRGSWDGSGKGAITLEPLTRPLVSMNGISGRLRR